MDTSKITDVLIFKDGYYWISVKQEESVSPAKTVWYGGYIIKEGLDRNGFEYASDAYAYMAELQKESDENIDGYNRIGMDGIPDRI